MIGLTHDQAACLRIMQDLVDQQVKLTYETLAAELGNSAKSVPFHLVRGLIERGYVERGPGRALTIRQRLAPLDEEFDFELTTQARAFIALEMEIAQHLGTVPVYPQNGPDIYGRKP